MSEEDAHTYTLLDVPEPAGGVCRTSGKVERVGVKSYVLREKEAIMSTQSIKRQANRDLRQHRSNDQQKYGVVVSGLYSKVVQCDPGYL